MTAIRFALPPERLSGATVTPPPSSLPDPAQVAAVLEKMAQACEPTIADIKRRRESAPTRLKGTRRGGRL